MCVGRCKLITIRAFLAAIGWTDASASNAYFWLQGYVKRSFSRLHAMALGTNNIEAQANPAKDDGGLNLIGAF